MSKFDWFALVLAVVTIGSGWYWWKFTRPFKAAIATVARVALVPRHRQWLVYDAAFYVAYKEVLRVLKTREGWPWLQQQVDNRLAELAATFNQACKEQERIRERLRACEKTRPGKVAGTEVAQIWCDLANATVAVNIPKRDFWALLNAAEKITLRTWKEMAFYVIFAPEESIHCPFESTVAELK